jgi:hypothetical protein
MPAGIDGTIGDALPPSTRLGIQGNEGAKGDPGPSGLGELLEALTPGEVPTTDEDGNLVTFEAIPASEKGAANGVAPLDGSGKLPDAAVPSSVASKSEVAAVLAVAEAAEDSSTAASADVITLRSAVEAVAAGGAMAKLSDDGVWTWFNGPRAAVYDGKLYTGFMRANGDVGVGQLDAATRKYGETLLHAVMEVDDHDNPAVCALPDGRIACFYARHPDPVLRFRISIRPGDISEFGPERTHALGESVSYANAHYLATEGRLYLTCRGHGGKPNVMRSADGGLTFSKAFRVFEGVGTRPYARYATDGAGRLHWFVSGDHPRESANKTVGLYHFYYDAADGFFHKSDGTQIRSYAAVEAGASLTVDDVTKVYDPAAEGNGWCWDIALLPNGRPVVTYTVYPTSVVGPPVAPADDHRLRYGVWNGTAWVSHPVVSTGPSLYGAGSTVEPQYSGGISLDPDDPFTIYICRNIGGTWELERWQTFGEGGEQWTRVQLTQFSGAGTKNIRPFAPKGRTPGIPTVLWSRGRYTTFLDYDMELWAMPSVPRVDLPTVTVQPAITGTPDVGATMTTTDGTWAAGVTVTGRQWTRDGVPIAGATGSTYVLTSADAGPRIGVTVTATNAAGTWRATAEPITLITGIAGIAELWEADTFASVDGVKVIKWPSQASDRVLTRADDTVRPVIRAAPTGFNGRPAIDFDGVDDWIYVLGGGGATARNKTGMTVLTVVRPRTSPTAVRNLVSITTNTDGVARASLEVGRTSGQFQAGGRRLDADSFQSITGGATTANQTRVVTGIFDWANTTLLLRLDGAQVAGAGNFKTAGATSDTDSANINIGGYSATSFDGLMAALIIITRVLTAGELKRVERYLGGKYGVTIP